MPNAVGETLMLSLSVNSNTQQGQFKTHKMDSWIAVSQEGYENMAQVILFQGKHFIPLAVLKYTQCTNLICMTRRHFPVPGSRTTSCLLITVKGHKYLFPLSSHSPVSFDWRDPDTQKGSMQYIPTGPSVLTMVQALLQRKRFFLNVMGMRLASINE